MRASRAGFSASRHSLTREASPKASPGTVSDAAENIETHLEMDREVFGADRSALLRSLAGSAPELVTITRPGGAVKGFALGRKGSQADHLGPWVAATAWAAREVFEGFLVRSRRQVVFADVVRDNP
jgi:hypothetical protein